MISSHACKTISCESWLKIRSILGGKWVHNIQEHQTNMCKESHNQVTLMNHNAAYLRGIPNSGQSVGDDDYSPAFHCSINGLLNQMLTLSIKGTRCLPNDVVMRYCRNWIINVRANEVNRAPMRLHVYYL